MDLFRRRYETGVGNSLSLFEGLSLLFLSSNACKNNVLVREMSNSPIRDDVAFEETCSLSAGAKCVISSCVFFFLAAVTSADTYRAKKKDERVAHMNPASIEPLILL